MAGKMNRRQLIGHSTAAVLAGTGLMHARTALGAGCTADKACAGVKRKFKLGLVTYNIGNQWDLPTVIKRCEECGIAAVELRSTHAHGVEPTLTKAQRAEVRKRFADTPVVLWGLGTSCQFHEADPAKVNENIDLAKRFIELAHDVGAKGIKVRPNGLVKDVPEEKTLEQIGQSLRVLGDAGAAAKIEIWTEVHGKDTCHPPRMRKIMDAADHPNVGVVWNSNNPYDLKDGSVKPYFSLLRDKIHSVHINELICGYPYRELFSLLNDTGYDRYTLIEAQPQKSASDEENLRFLKYYIALWNALSQPA